MPWIFRHPCARCRKYLLHLKHFQSVDWGFADFSKLSDLVPLSFDTEKFDPQSRKLTNLPSSIEFSALWLGVDCISWKPCSLKPVLMALIPGWLKKWH